MFEALLDSLQNGDEVVFYRQPGAGPMVEVTVPGDDDRSSFQLDPRGLSDDALLRAVRTALDELRSEL